MFLGHFWSFIDRDFFQKLCHTQLYMSPYCHAKFQKKLMFNSEKTYRQTEGWKEGWTEGWTEGRTDPIL